MAVEGVIVVKWPVSMPPHQSAAELQVLEKRLAVTRDALTIGEFYCRRESHALLTSLPTPAVARLIVLKMGLTTGSRKNIMFS